MIRVRILSAEADGTVTVPMPEAEYDIDTQADYAAVLEKKLYDYTG